jgi:hypothetical protein
MVTGGSVGIKVNDDIGPYFQTKRGLRQGDPMSPILFNIVADMLALLINRAKADGQIRGVIPHLIDDGLSILQYADDTIIFIDHNLEQAQNLKASAMELIKRWNPFILVSLDAILVNIPSDILGSLCIIDNSLILNGEK